MMIIMPIITFPLPPQEKPLISIGIVVSTCYLFYQFSVLFLASFQTIFVFLDRALGVLSRNNGNLFMLNALGKVRKVFQGEGKVIWAVEKVKEKSKILCSIEAKLLLAPFASKWVNYSRHSESLKYVRKSTIHCYRRKMLSISEFFRIFKDSLCLA